MLEGPAREVQMKQREVTEGLKYELCRMLRGALEIEIGRCPLSNDEISRVVSRYLGDPRIDKSTERKLEAIPKFSGNGSD